MAASLIYRNKNWLDRHTHRFDLFNADGQLYLTRWTLLRFRSGKKLMLHRMSGPDGDRFLHDHPWRFTSLILWGGYTEEVLYETLTPLAPMRSARRSYGWLNTHRVPATGFWHKIVSLKKTPTWTLVITGPFERSWGFMTSVGWVPYHKFHDRSVTQAG